MLLKKEKLQFKLQTEIRMCKKLVVSGNEKKSKIINQNWMIADLYQ